MVLWGHVRESAHVLRARSTHPFLPHLSQANCSPVQGLVAWVPGVFVVGRVAFNVWISLKNMFLIWGRREKRATKKKPSGRSGRWVAKQHLQHWDKINWLVVTGTMEFYDFPFSWECHHPNRRTPSHQPVKILLNLTCKLQNPAVPLQWIYYDIFGYIFGGIWWAYSWCWPTIQTTGCFSLRGSCSCFAAKVVTIQRL